MKKTQWKELSRTIRKTIVTFLSISIIIALGVSVYLGINYAAQALRNMKNTVFQSQNYRDFEIISTLGIDQENVEKLKKIDGISTAEGNYIVDGTVSAGSKNESVNLAGITTDLNRPTLEEGEEPENDQECLVDRAVANKLNLKPGDKVKIKCTASKEAVSSGEYKVSGIVSYADSYRNHRFVFFKKSLFNASVFENAYTNVYVQVKDSSRHNLFGKSYKKISDKVYALLQSESDEESTRRYQRIYDKWKAKLDEGKRKLEEAWQKIQDGEKQIEDGENEIAQNEEKLKNAQEKIQSGEKELQEGWKKLEKGKAQLADAKQKLDTAWSQLEDGRQQLEDGRSQLEAGEEQLDQKRAEYQKAKDDIRNSILERIRNGEYEELEEEAKEWFIEHKDRALECIANLDTSQSIDQIILQFVDEMGLDDEVKDMIRSELQKMEQYKKIKQIETELADARSQLDAGWDEYNEKTALYNQKLEEYNSKYAEYEAGQKKYQDGWNTYNQKKAELEDGKTRYAEGVKQLEEGKEKLEAGKAELADKKTEYESGVKTYTEQETKLNSLQKAPWYILGRNASRPYLSSEQQSDKLAGIGFTFALTLMLVAVMVCYASISRMIQEQRQLIGAQKALGFKTGEILLRYLLYSVTSVIIGLAVGIAIAYYLIQPICINAYVSLGGYGEIRKCFLPEMTLIVAACAIFIALLSTWLACHKMLKKPAVELMKEEAPRGTGTVLDRFRWWNRLPLLTKATINNMVTEKARVFTTLAGVTGCTILLVMGFSLKLSSDKIPDRQYGELVKYDKELTVSSAKTTEDTEKKITEVLDHYNVSWIPVIKQTWTYMVGDNANAAEMIGSSEDIGDYYTLLDAKTGEKLKSAKDGILICEGIADSYGLGDGDSIRILDSSGNVYKLKIRGVYENHVWQNFVISPEYYQKVFGKEMPQNARFLKLNGASEKQLKKELLKIPSVTGIKKSDATRSIFQEMSGSTNIILAMMIGMSILMALMILLNLAVMNINQKKRELAVMRVNGFTLRETKRYVGLDTIFITIVGIILGVLIGTVLTAKIQETLNATDMHFLKGIQFEGWGMAVAIIVVFTVVIRWIANRKISKLNLTNVNS